MTSSTIWYSISEPPPQPPYKFVYERDAFRDGQLVHVEACPLWTMCHRDFLALLQLWNQRGEEPSIFGKMTYRYREVPQP